MVIIKIETYGKMYIVGEYSVLSNKGSALVYGINRKMFFEIKDSKTFSYTTRGKKHSFVYNDENIEANNNYNLLNKTIGETFKYLEHYNININPFHLAINSELEKDGTNKYGFGSSSALIIGVIKSILTFCKVPFTNELIFKLGVFSQYSANEISSGGDLAAALYGGLIYYKRYDEDWLSLNKNFKNLYELKLKGLIIKPFSSNIKFSAVYTNTSYSFKKLSYNLNETDYIKANLIVDSAYENLTKNNLVKLKEDILNYQILLEEFIKEDKLYTKELKLGNKLLKEFNLSSKISGAGGGDSLIFVEENIDYTLLEETLNYYYLKLIRLNGDNND